MRSRTFRLTGAPLSAPLAVNGSDVAADSCQGLPMAAWPTPTTADHLGSRNAQSG